MKRIFKKSYLLIGLVIFIWIIKDIDIVYLKEAAYKINPLYYIAAAFLYLPIIFIRSYKWKKIMDIQKIHYSAKDSFFMYGSGLLLSLITPGRVGDFSKIAYLKKDKYSFGRAFLGNFLDKIFDLAFILLFIIVGILFLPFTPHFSLSYLSLFKWGALIALFLAALVIFFYFKNKSDFYNFIFEMKKDIRQFKIKSLAFISFLTSLSLFAYFLLIYLIAASINLHEATGFFYFAFASLFIILAAILPISVLGIGTREAALIFLFQPLGVPKETIILFSLLIMINYIALFFICFFCWVKKPIPISLNS